MKDLRVVIHKRVGNTSRYYCRPGTGPNSHPMWRFVNCHFCLKKFDASLVSGVNWFSKQDLK